MIILISSLLYLLLIVPSGTNFCYDVLCGVHFWGVHYHDAMWHLAIANTSLLTYPPLSPIFAGATLSGYNYGFDWLILLLSKAGIDSTFAYFKVIPLIWVIVFSQLLNRYAHKRGAFHFLAVFFTGSFAYLLTLWHNGTLWGSAGLLSNPVLHLASNPPFSFSVLCILAIMLITRSTQYSPLRIWGLILLSTLSFSLKFYAGVAAGWLVFWYLIVLVENISWRARLSYVFLLAVAFTGALIFWYRPAIGAPAVFVLDPLALIHRITEEPQLLYSRVLTNARYTLVADGGFSIRLVLIEIYNVLAYHIFTYGVRLLGLGYLGYLVLTRRTQSSKIMLALAILLLLIPALFVQRGEWWNVMQFGDYASFFMALYLGELLFVLWSSRRMLSRVAVFLILALGSINQIDLVRVFAFEPPASTITRSELSALSYLQALPSGVVGTDAWRGHDYNSPYVSTLTKKQLYFDDISMLKVTGVDYQARHAELIVDPCSILSHVNYLYSNDVELTQSLYKQCPSITGDLLYESGGFAIYGASGIQ